jgi:hypothetical protein
MKTTHAIVIGAALVATLAGCGSSDKPKAATAPAPGSTASSTDASPPVPDASASIDPGSDPGTLDAASAYLAALGKIDKALVGDTRAALDHGQAVCIDIEERRTDAQQEKNVATNFAVDATKAKQILALTKQNLCLQ